MHGLSLRFAANAAYYVKAHNAQSAYSDDEADYAQTDNRCTRKTVHPDLPSRLRRLLMSAPSIVVGNVPTSLLAQ